jgi:hypothetical protein
VIFSREHQYEMPDTLLAGPTLFHFTDDGKQLHHMTIVKLEQGKTLADCAALSPGPFRPGSCHGRTEYPAAARRTG